MKIIILILSSIIVISVLLLGIISFGQHYNLINSKYLIGFYPKEWSAGNFSTSGYEPTLCKPEEEQGEYGKFMYNPTLPAGLDELDFVICPAVSLDLRNLIDARLPKNDEYAGTGYYKATPASRFGLRGLKGMMYATGPKYGTRYFEIYIKNNTVFYFEVFTGNNDEIDKLFQFINVKL